VKFLTGGKARESQDSGTDLVKFQSRWFAQKAQADVSNYVGSSRKRRQKALINATLSVGLFIPSSIGGTGVGLLPKVQMVED